MGPEWSSGEKHGIALHLCFCLVGCLWVRAPPQRPRGMGGVLKSAVIGMLSLVTHNVAESRNIPAELYPGLSFCRRLERSSKLSACSSIGWKWRRN
jgi:hypothetical protein